MKTTNLTHLILTTTLVLLFASSCKKDDNSPSNPTNGKSMAVFNPDLTYGTLTDIDGNEYKTIKIGNQTWMAENLRTFKYNDGTAIPNVKEATEWDGLTTGAYCTYWNTTKNDSIATFGCLYNWYAVNTGKLAPKGWHVATKDEWSALETYLASNGFNIDDSGESIEIAKSMVSEYSWNKIDILVDGSIGSSKYPEYVNKAGFTALAGGYRNKAAEFKGINSDTGWWTSNEKNTEKAEYCGLSTIVSSLWYISGYKCDGFYVRCIKD